MDIRSLIHPCEDSVRNSMSSTPPRTDTASLTTSQDRSGSSTGSSPEIHRGTFHSIAQHGPASEQHNKNPTLKDFLSTAFRGYEAVGEMISLVSDLAMEHIAITGILHGWDQVRTFRGLDLVVEMFENMDQDLATSKDRVTRLGIVMMPKIWKAQYINSESNRREKERIPAYLWPLAAQKNLPQGHIVRGIPWPAMRERLSTQLYKYENDERFWAVCMRHWRIACPHDFSDIFNFGSLTGLYQFESKFRQRFWDLNSWTLCSDFFAEYPEFQGVIPKYESQLAVYKLQDMTEEHERIIDRVDRDSWVQTKMRKYRDSMPTLETQESGR